MLQTLAAWLDYIEHQHTRPVDLGLERLLPVKAALGQRQTCPVITVAGTNGKGSTCAMLEAILLAAGHRVGLYTSPHLLAYNERVRIDGQAVDDQALCAAFARVNAARSATPLTYFEFGTLAAWEVFATHALDAIILEVGLGGRLDAVNSYDADTAIVTGIAIDHTEYLGNTRDAIGFEKAGIFRCGRPAICADAAPPASLIRHATETGSRLLLIGRDFGHAQIADHWRYWHRTKAGVASIDDLPMPQLAGAFQLDNASAALAALGTLQGSLPTSAPQLRSGLARASLPGRFQRLPGRPQIILDVAHNPESALGLASNLAALPGGGKSWAVFGMLADKDINAVIQALSPHIDHWLPCSLAGARAADKAHLSASLALAAEKVTASFDTPAAALAYATGAAGEDDRIIVFGSFLTVAEAMQSLKLPEMGAHDR